MFIANAIFGVNHLISKGVMPEKINASTFILFRVLGAGILFWLINLFNKEKVEKKDLFKLFICGILGASINQFFLFKGISLTSPIDSSIIVTSVPVLVIIFSAFILKEKITKNKILGILLGCIGAIVLILYGNKTSGTSSNLGNLFVFGNALFYALYLIIVKPLLNKYKPITVVSWVFFFGLLIVVPFSINDFLTTDFSSFTSQTYLSISFVIFFTTFLTYFLNIYATNHLQPSITGSYIYIQPIISFIAIITYSNFLDDNKYDNDIDFVKIICSILIASGIFLISKKTKTSLE